MGATASIVPMLLGAQQASGVLQQAGILPKTPGPLVIMQPPGAPDMSNTQNAADKARKKTAAGEGPSDTNLTGPRGLGEVPGANLQAKTLLGY